MAQEIVNYAIEEGYYDPDAWPYTYPADLVRLAEDYAPGQVHSGQFEGGGEEQSARDFLWQQLSTGNAVLVDVRVGYDTDQPRDSHFALVVGINADGVFMNDPYGDDGTAAQAGRFVPWDDFNTAWSNNPDPIDSEHRDDRVDRWWMTVEPAP